jgi:hypothetical protein
MSSKATKTSSAKRFALHWCTTSAKSTESGSVNAFAASACRERMGAPQNLEGLRDKPTGFDPLKIEDKRRNIRKKMNKSASLQG